ncbi:hypothetical protein BT69DRAFT_1279199 [Atractiella rhizophila]|nr:hypothetical protein BT69DRAFT_1279199 [Atractiella rhizophila]
MANLLRPLYAACSTGGSLEPPKLCFVRMAFISITPTPTHRENWRSFRLIQLGHYLVVLCGQSISTLADLFSVWASLAIQCSF